MNKLKKIATITIIALSFNPAGSLAITPTQYNSIHNTESVHYIADDSDICGSNGAAGPDTVEGHTLPAAHGGVGLEEAIDAQGRVASTGGRVSFYQNASKGQAFRDYYITMRWRYRNWNWNGTSETGPEAVSFYSKVPRIEVTNPRTKKTITTVVMEAGPAPWTGADKTPNNVPKQGWKNPQDGTPETYKGRVSGLPPVAFNALGAAMRMSDGSGDDLQYSWSDDQGAQPGPADGSTAVEDDSTPDCSNGNTDIVNDGNYDKDTVDMQCPTDPDIKDAGTDTGYANNKPYKIRLCSVHGIRVNVLVASQIDKMLDAAVADGKKFGGGGFRTMSEQISLRSTNGCPDTYKAPASSCRVPTARPGYSNHQMGLAIDFTYDGSLIGSHSNGGFKWLSANAAKLAGYKNLPSEPWHWSVNGK